jgi:hypothetical protein
MRGRYSLAAFTATHPFPGGEGEPLYITPEVLAQSISPNIKNDKRQLNIEQ